MYTKIGAYKDFKISIFLRDNVQPATGCTELTAPAWAVAIAVHAAVGNIPRKGADGVITFNQPTITPQEIQNNLKSIHIVADLDTFKNGYNVFVPSTNQQGIVTAAAMGALRNPQSGLNLLGGIPQSDVDRAVAIRSKIPINLVCDYATAARAAKKIIGNDLDIRVQVVYGDKTVFVRIFKKHTNIDIVKVNGKTVYKSSEDAKKLAAQKVPQTIGEFIKLIEQTEDTDIPTILAGLKMNYQIALEGLRNDYGLISGIAHLRSLFPGKNSLLSAVRKNPETIFELKGLRWGDLARILASAASDVRMGGGKLPTMTSNGSGNQGITTQMSIIAAYYALTRDTAIGKTISGLVNKGTGIDEKRFAKAALLSHLITRFATDTIGLLGSPCGCATRSGIGAISGLVYLFGGNEAQMHQGINHLLADLAGQACDGAKPSCALKLGTSTILGVDYAAQALQGAKIADYNGIVHPDAFDSIRAFGRISLTTGLQDVAIGRTIDAKGQARTKEALLITQQKIINDLQRTKADEETDESDWSIDGLGI